MLRLLIILVLLTVFPAYPARAAEDVVVTADSAVLIDAHTGQVLYAKNASWPRPPASTTKIATALVALEMGDLEDTVTVSRRAALVGESSMHLREGEQLSLEQLLTGALVRSGNDACVAIAEHLAGSEEVFARLVTGRVTFLGAKNTHFVNSNGLPAPGHLSSALDLATITRYALTSPVFRRIVGTRFTVVHGSRDWVHSLTNTNKLLWKYPGADGVKTGTTVEAGQCLVASATRGDMCLISVVLHSDARYNDTVKLMEYGFNCFEPKTIVQQGEVLKIVNVTRGTPAGLSLVADRTLVFLAPKGNNPAFQKEIILRESRLRAPVKRGSKLGRVVVFCRGEPLGYANLVARTTVDSNVSFLEDIKGFAEFMQKG